METKHHPPIIQICQRPETSKTSQFSESNHLSGLPRPAPHDACVSRVIINNTPFILGRGLDNDKTPED